MPSPRPWKMIRLRVVHLGRSTCHAMSGPLSETSLFQHRHLVHPCTDTRSDTGMAEWYRCTSLMGNNPLLGPYSRPMPRVLRGS